VPLPVPLAPEVMFIQLSLLTAVQEQAGAIVTSTLSVPPLDVKDLSVGEIIGAGGGVTVTVNIASVKSPQPSVTRSAKLAVVAAHAATTSAKTWPLALGAAGLSMTVTPLTVALVPPLTLTVSVSRAS